MKVSGSHTVAAPREQVWAALQDPRVLVRTIPGCLQLERTGDDAYRMRVEAGVASIRGVYHGTVALADQSAPEAYTLSASGQGAPGTVDATARITLADDADGGTRVTYDCDAVVGGTVGGVGQRVLAGVAKRTAGQFFDAVDAYLSGALPEPAPAAAPAGAGEPAHAAEVFHAPPRPPAAAPDPRWLLAAGVCGALVALLGVVVGRRSAR